MIRIAIAKGRISSDVISLLEDKGLSFCEDKDSRKLILTEKSGICEIILVKPADTAVYVEQGVAECGIVGRDIIIEDDPDVYCLFPIPVARCRMCVAGPSNLDYRSLEKVVAATKYNRVAKNYFQQRNQPCEIIHLNGSVELAPILGMSDVIVDIVQTGDTLRENGLSVLDTLFDITAVFIVNKAALKTKHTEITALAELLERNRSL